MSNEQLPRRGDKSNPDKELPFMNSELIAEAQEELRRQPGGDPGDPDLITRVVARSQAKRRVEDSVTDEERAQAQGVYDSMNQVVSEYREKIGLPPEETSGDSE